MAEVLFIDGPADRTRRELPDPAPSQQFYVTLDGRLTSSADPDLKSVRFRKHLYLRSHRTTRGTYLYEYMGETPGP